MDERRLLAIMAHPDDESMGVGGALARYAAEGAGVYLITATRGQLGWFGDEASYPGPQILGAIREQELYAAARILGLREVHLLDYMDGALDQAQPNRIIAQLVSHIRRIRPQVVLTFDPNGYYGHPDHIAISQFTTAALIAAADGNFKDKSAPHRVSKLYYLAANKATQDAYEAAFGELTMKIDGVERRSTPWADWAITTRIDTSAHWQKVWQAISCHRSQLPGYQKLLDLPEEYHQNMWGAQTFYRAMSLVNSGRAVESDLFSGVKMEQHPLEVAVTQRMTVFQRSEILNDAA
jgi:LmbE family N-acetylglucosaminyl deacetylase